MFNSSCTNTPRLELSIEEVKEEVARDNSWAKSKEGRELLLKHISLLTTNQPRNHILSESLQSYLEMRGIFVPQAAAQEKIRGEDNPDRTQEDITTEIEEAIQILMKRVKVSDFKGVEEQEEKIALLEQLKSKSPKRISSSPLKSGGTP